MAKGLLIDTTRCQGCRGCQSACKNWWDLPGWTDEPDYKTEFSPTMTNPPQLNAHTWNIVEFYEVEDEGKFSWNFVHKRCLHCLEPACVSVCPVGALQKLENGPVVWEEGRCIGCRYCQMACPFDIPKFEWDKAWPKIQKCNFCWDRLEKGQEPACAKTCPSKAIQFGERSELLAEAYDRIQKNPDKYFGHIYGETEAGGTAVMYMTAVPPEKVGFKTEEIVKDFYPPMTWEFLSKISWEIAGIAAILAGTWYFRRMRTKGSQEKEGTTSGKEAK